MQVLIVHCHPEPRSFNGALTEIARDFFLENSDQVEISDLYAEQFDPVERAAHYVNPENAEIFSALAEQRNAYRTNSLPPEIVREIERLERSDLVIFQFPIWWHSVPAMLKGWMDRVFVSGGLYTSSMRYDRGYFKGRRALCSVTSGAPAESFEP
ncbi:MAG: NAD(P)H-dependent oxidoreductase, partial [Pseudomonadota bacterium]